MAAYAGAEDIPGSASRDRSHPSKMAIVCSICRSSPRRATPREASRWYDAASGLLVAGDALRTEGGRPGLPGSQFTEDMDEAIRLWRNLVSWSFETLLVGHGDPLEGGASALVAELAANQ